MKITNMTNLWIGYNCKEDFRVLICAEDEIEAQSIANEYCSDNKMEGEFEISFFVNDDVRIDCDYVLQ